MVEGEDEKKLHEVAKELVELVKKHLEKVESREWMVV